MKVKNLLFDSMGTGRPAGDFGLLVMRAGFGAYMAVAHGYGKIPPSEGFIGGTANLGFPAPELFAWLAALAEFGGGILLAIGLATRTAALALASTMAVAAFMAHANDPWFSMDGRSKEMAMLYLIPSVALLFTGPGRFSVDAMITGKSKR
jgi:putative oxidoreductase